MTTTFVTRIARALALTCTLLAGVAWSPALAQAPAAPQAPATPETPAKQG